MQIVTRRLIALVASVCTLVATTPGAVSAAMIGTQTAISIEQRVEHIDQISRWLMRDDVASKLKGLGVSADEAKKRVAVMTDAELMQIQQSIHNLPAGAGVLEVIGIVFVVLIILELLGVTNVFSRL